MGFWDILKDQFLDVIEYEDKSNKLIVVKFQRESGNNELKQGSKVIVREGQCAVFFKGGQLADLMYAGTYSLNTDNFPVLSKLEAFPYFWVSPVIADIYFVSLKQFIDNKWATKNPIIKRDKDFNMVRIRAFGKFSFQVIDVALFMRELFYAKGIMMSYDIVQYLSSMVTEVFATAVGATGMSILDLATGYKAISSIIQEILNQQTLLIGIQFSDVIIENISLPDEVEKLIDEQSGVGIAQHNMENFVQYQTVKAIRDAATQNGGLAGLGASVAFGNIMAQNIQKISTKSSQTKNKAEMLRELKALLDEGILTQEEFDKEKQNILSN